MSKRRTLRSWTQGWLKMWSGVPSIISMVWLVTGRVGALPCFAGMPCNTNMKCVTGRQGFFFLHLSTLIAVVLWEKYYQCFPYIDLFVTACHNIKTDHHKLILQKSLTSLNKHKHCMLQNQNLAWVFLHHRISEGNRLSSKTFQCHFHLHII